MTPISNRNPNVDMTKQDWASLEHYDKAMQLLQNPDFLEPDYCGAVTHLVTAITLGYHRARFNLQELAAIWQTQLIQIDPNARQKWQAAVEKGQQLALNIR